MSDQNYTVIGVMSGTSLDGIDLAHIRFRNAEGKWAFEIRESETIPYPEDWLEKLRSAVSFNTHQLDDLNEEYTQLLGKTIRQFIDSNQITRLDAVCSHGHTILHQPENGITLQIGNLPQLADLVGERIVCDFRVQDVKLGGQGAPLVPIGDRMLFADYEYCLNLGGFSNVSFEQNGRRIAFDISPVNTVLNFYAHSLGMDYDDKGAVSRSGNMNTYLWNDLNELEYYKKPYPKSLGFEFVKATVLPLMETHSIPTEDKMHTFVEHIAHQTAMALPIKEGKLLATGGGAYHDFLMERLQFYLPDIAITIPDAKILEYKEALIFGMLGVLRLRNEINVLSSVTGARKDHSSGMVYD